jgi:hypothetical protein
MSIISAVAWVIKYSDALGWIIFGTALGGFVTPRFNTSSLATNMLAGIKESV